jgi:ATP-dependent helicase/nuclease subunit B
MKTKAGNDATLKRLEHQAEHARVWNELIELLDQMVDVLGDELINADDFVEILQTALAAFDLALTPPTVDQVLVGSVDRTRTPPQLAAVIVLGLNEGSFPYCPKENSIFCDAERRELVRQRIEIDPDTHRRLFDERFFAYLAFTRASEYVCVMRPLADDEGRPMAPSAFWNQLREIFPTVTPTTLPRDATRHAEHIGTPRQLVTSLLQWARSPKSSDSVWPALYDRFARHECRLDCPDAIDTMRYRAWRALSYENNARLSAEVAARLFPDPLSASVSRIETFANCPFKHFARYGLRLDPRDDQDVTAMDLGNAYHSILETLVRQIVERREDFASVSPQFAEQQIRAAAQHIGESLRNEVLLSSARNQYLLRHVERTVERIVAAQREVAKHGKFRPWKAELAFGFSDEASLPPLELNTAHIKLPPTMESMITTPSAMLRLPPTARSFFCPRHRASIPGSGPARG